MGSTGKRSSEPEGIPQEDQYSYAEDTTDYNRSNKRTDDYDTNAKTDDDKKNEDERERSFNVYNKLLQNKPNEEYDHINDTSSAKINIDSQYHCTEAETGDTYSHLHPQVFGKHITDNTYNVTESSTSDGDYNSVLAKPEIEVAEDGKLIVNDPRVKPGEDMWIGVYLAPRGSNGIIYCENIWRLQYRVWLYGVWNKKEQQICDECTTQGNCLIFQYNDTNQQRVFEWRSCDRDESYRVLCSNMPFSKYGPSCTNEFGYLKKKHGIYEVKFEGEIKSKLSLCEEESSAAILAGILVPMTLLIAVIIIIIVAIKKRDILRSWFTSCISERNERQCRSKPSQEISNPVLNSTTNTEQDLKTSVNNPSHVVREKPIQGASGFVKTKTDTEPYALPGDMYAEYDTLKESNNSNQSEDHDHANTARFVNGSPLKVNFADADLVYNEVSVTDGNDYDHIATQNIDSDNDNGIERQTADGTDDAYNNLNIDRKSSSETDNPNNIPNNLNNDNGNAYRDDNPYNFPDNVNSDD
ncbi:hypothetical protein MAR_020049 [Mya arenaria]|uniref:Uncharacterized protein n=1 Tax=Mya arenaria TaxID=6604 RepID=A0ABY7E4C4_MYAAR|nr:hypothetical protein MAR_020049 [Mya arenaria]